MKGTSNPGGGETGCAPAEDDQIPMWLWRAGQAGFAAAIVITLTLLVLTLSGVADPDPVGELTIHDELDSGAGWTIWPEAAYGEVRGSAYHVTAPLAEMRVLVVSPHTTGDTGTLEIAARQADGPREAGYGLWWGDGPDGAYTVMAVNGDGYFAVLHVDGPTVDELYPWQLFPHIDGQGGINRLRVDFQDGQALARINDEIAARFDDPQPEGERGAGFYIQTFNRGLSLVAFDRLRIWSAS